MKLVTINLENETHCEALLQLLNHYMLDPMGGGKPMEPSHPTLLIPGLKKQCNYQGFLVSKNGAFVGLANCFIGYSTFKAKQLINIHDFIVHPNYRQMGVGEFLLNGIAAFAQNNNMCRVSLEVREDNPKAMNLYTKLGFAPCTPNMFFWEKPV